MGCCGFGGTMGGGGGGGGNISGTLTEGFIPVAAGPNTIEDGPLRVEPGPADPGIYWEEDTPESFYFVRGAGIGAELVWRTSRGTVAAPTALVDADPIALLEGAGYDGSSFLLSGTIRLVADGAPVDGVRAPGRWEFLTWDEDGDQNIGMIIDKDGIVEIKEQIVIEKTSRRLPTALSIVANETDIDAALSDFFTLAMTDDTEVQVPTNAQTGRSFMLRVKMDGASALTFDAAGFRFTAAPTLDDTADSFTYLGFIYNEDDAIWDCVGPAIGPFGP